MKKQCTSAFVNANVRDAKRCFPCYRPLNTIDEWFTDRSALTNAKCVLWCLRIGMTLGTTITAVYIPAKNRFCVKRARRPFTAQAICGNTKGDMTVDDEFVQL